MVLSPALRAQRTETRTEFNKILFSISGQSWSLRDQQIYQAVLVEVFKRKSLSPYSTNESDDFVTSRLAEKESNLFDLTTDPVKVTEAQKKRLSNFTSAEIDKEIASISKATAIIEIKESKNQDQARFKTWVELLKRKYQFKIKSGEVAPMPMSSDPTKSPDEQKQQSNP